MVLISLAGIVSFYILLYLLGYSWPPKVSGN